YWSPGSCARVPFIALEETGAPFTLHVLNRYIGDHQTAEYRAINPKQKVPAIVLDAWTVTENPVIQAVLARRFPEAKLLPVGDERITTEASSLMSWFASGIQPAAGRQRFPSAFSDDESSFDRIRAFARQELEKSFSILEDRLSDRPWLFEEWSIVDAYMLWLWFRAIGSGMDGTPFPRCADHARRTEGRPSVAKVLDREEAEFTRFEASGTVPAAIPSYQVGRTPTADLIGQPAPTGRPRGN
ncbi:MAG: glutathione S-transferase family protein, partial [Actinomycetota bacterium]|nr:glutathione S-transferase family protein [Actinomycetota bacterium]